MEEQVKSFLDEGFDFIEEGVSGSPLEFTESNGEIIVESENGEKSPYHVLGVCRGVFQPINEPSRNRRIYESNHWEVQLSKPEVQERLKTRSMWGTLGHFDRRITDADIREGLVSHIITKLDIREDVNGKPYLYGELEILDTPSGRILEGMYKGGANLFVSSRGAGKLLTVIGDDLKHVDPNSFWFEGFDIVRAAGFPKARPVYESAVSEDKKEAVHESEKDSARTTTSGSTWAVPVAASEPIKVVTEKEVDKLKSQIDKLAKIVEKVVDDVYETQEEPKEKVMAEKPKEAPQMQEQPIAPVQKEKANEALVDFVNLMASTNISEDKFSEILDIIAASKKENK
jgi:hypothetical protein